MENTNRRGFLGKLCGLLGLAATVPAVVTPVAKEARIDDMLGPCHPDWVRTTCTVTDLGGKPITLGGKPISIAYFRQT